MQDVGYLIDYDKHHKHSYHLILNSRLAGFRPQELELIANIARYHRGGKPKAKHANYDRLAAADQERVRRLAAILRIAGGLDRSHSQQVRGVELEFSPLRDHDARPGRRDARGRLVGRGDAAISSSGCLIFRCASNARSGGTPHAGRLERHLDQRRVRHGEGDQGISDAEPGIALAAGKRNMSQRRR